MQVQSRRCRIVKVAHFVEEWLGGSARRAGPFVVGRFCRRDSETGWQVSDVPREGARGSRVLAGIEGWARAELHFWLVRE